MQDLNKTFLDFSSRTDVLAARLGVNIQDLPDYIGLSRSSLFALRKGERSVTPKNWAKLEEAENKAGLESGPEKVYPQSTSPEPVGMVMDRYPSTPPMKIEDRLEVLEQQHAEMLHLLSEIRNGMQGGVPSVGSEGKSEEKPKKKGTTNEHE